MEYIAVFLAVLFPGALVAFNHELLLALPRFAALRVYCAGIWHNAVFCVACALALLLLPLALCPLYVHGESLMVLELSSESPLSAYLSPRDLIVSLDGIRIRDLQDWRHVIAILNEQALQNVHSGNDLRGSIKVNGRKGYCTPYSIIEETMDIQLEGNQTICPHELSAFASISCLHSIAVNNNSLDGKRQKGSRSIHCLDAKDVVQLKKCGDGWVTAQTHSRGCLCSEGHSCLAPVEIPGQAWVEITYISLSSPRCKVSKNSFLEDKELDIREMSCLRTFVFIGDVKSIAESICLTSYQPQGSLAFGIHLPNMLEKLLVCAFQVSLALALLNSLPVYFLDGESMLEVVVVEYLSILGPRKRGTLLRWCLLGGTLICLLLLLNNLFVISKNML